MASLWKRHNSPYWVACFTAGDGRQLKRSTKERSRRLAMRIANEYEAAAAGKRTAKQVRQVIETLHREITGQVLETRTVAAFVAEWLEEKKPETSLATFRAYKTHSDKLLAFLGARAQLDIGLVTHDDLLKLRAGALKSVHPGTVNHLLKIVRMIFRAAYRKRLCAENPAEFLESVKARRDSPRRPFTLDELRAVLAVADDEWRSLILFGIYSGQRLSDLARLTWRNVDIEQGTLNLVTGKTEKRIILPMPEPLKEHLATIAVSDLPGDPLHPRAFEAIQRSRASNTLSRRFGELLADAGLRAAVTHQGEGKGRGARRRQSELSFHSLRHTASTLLKEAGVPDAVVMQYIGHESAAMSRHYTHVGKEALADAAAKMPRLT